ncbi:hypothetical protein D0Y65_049297 [Glycine soja]|uniref:Uncharacterized protein n=1 Tax=Glycine soja TaxID=3848 RepID=A0A445FWR5_GLYSO|nr:hypothetical protein D0Y65_049297 [Glycine soja]|eukprot:XP_014625902.1 uncharacterized protein LOC100810863 isoform X2 [Glycine max]
MNFIQLHNMYSSYYYPSSFCGAYATNFSNLWFNRRGTSIEPFSDPPNSTSNLMANFGTTQRTPNTTTTPSPPSLDPYEPKGPHEKLYTDFKIYWPFTMPLTSEAAAIRVIRNLEHLGLYYTLFVWIILFIVLIPHLLWVSHHAFEIEDDSGTKELTPLVGHNGCACRAKALENV